MRSALVKLLILIAVALSPPAEAKGRSESLRLPPAEKMYHGVYPGGVDGEEEDITLNDVLQYEAASGQHVAWVYFSNNWYKGRAFPLSTAQWIRAHGAVPYIRLMMRSEDHKPGKPERVFSLQAIIQGKFDDDLRAWARAARDFQSPILVEYGTEMNGDWFGWNGRYHGGARQDRFGDPRKPDGPERFVAAWRHIVGLMREEGASNLVWVWHPDSGDNPDFSWNRLENYYPGDDVVDWVGVSCYGYHTPMDRWEPESFRLLMDRFYERLQKLAPGKPLIVAEFGQTAGNPRHSASEWAANALDDLFGGRWPRVIGFSWWNERWENDDNAKHNTTMRLQDNKELATVFFEKLSKGRNRLQTTPVVGSR
jgi:hypothetical protein